MDFTSIFSNLKATHESWSALSSYLRSAEGGSLHVQEYGTEGLAIVRYVKDHSNMSLPHVRAFRSVVWNTAENVPVSVTAFKSEDGEQYVLSENMRHLQVEEFVDGVMIGQFWDAKTESWRIHTRSTLDAKCRYYSKTRSFADLFQEAWLMTFDQEVYNTMDKTVTYTWILSHRENRIVCPAVVPRLTLVQMTRVNADATVESVKLTEAPELLKKLVPRQYMSRDAVGMDVTHVAALLAMMNGNLQHQGIVLKNDAEPFRRWKMRSTMYKTVRQLRGNSARRDFLWMDLWSKGLMTDYLTHYPEERGAANNILNAWKSITQDTYKAYVDGFKARTLDRKTIHPRLRPFVYALHNHYLTVLKPAHKPLDWKEAVRFMNERDTAQKIFAINWDVRKAAQSTIPLEPLPTSHRVELPADTAPVAEDATDTVQ